MTTIDVHLDDAIGFWHRSGTTWVRGHAFGGDALLRPAALAVLIDETPMVDLPSLVGALNGFFSVVSAREDAVFLAVDHVRTHPLFYATADGAGYVSNDAHWIRERLSDPRVNPLREFEFLLTEVVTGRDTLYDDIEQLEAGEYVVLESDGGAVTASPTVYTRFAFRPSSRASERDLLEALDAVVDRAFDRLVAVAGGRQLALSLSGGPDSRLIACELSERGYDPFVTFTYGLEGNWDSAVASEVAADLALPLEVVEYDHDMWYEWFHSPERTAYYRHAFNFADLPAIGAVPAVGELRRRGVLDDDALVLCGNLFPTRYDYPRPFHRPGPFTRADLVEIILDRYFDTWEWEDPEAAAAFRSRIDDQLDLSGPAGVAEALAVYTDWRHRNLRAKLMIKPQEYDFWGYDSWTPLVDREYVRFWETVPIEHRDGKRLHVRYVDRRYDALTGRTRPSGAETIRRPLQRLERAIISSPIERVIRPMYVRVEEPYKRLTRPSPYFQDPTGSTGIVTETQWDALCRSYDQDVHPFKALELLGCVRFDPPENLAGPVDGVLERNRISAPGHTVQRAALPWFVGDAGGSSAVEALPSTSE